MFEKNLVRQPSTSPTLATTSRSLCLESQLDIELVLSGSVNLTLNLSCAWSSVGRGEFSHPVQCTALPSASFFSRTTAEHLLLAHSSPTTLLRLRLPRGACALRIRLSQLKGVGVTEVVQAARRAERACRKTSTNVAPAPTCKILYSAEPISVPSADGAEECFACPCGQRCLGEAHTLQCTPREVGASASVGDRRVSSRCSVVPPW